MSASLSGQKTISGLHTTAITLSAGTYADPTTNVGTIDLAAAGTAVVAASAWTLDNAGLIVATASATDFGISFAAGGFVDNEAGAAVVVIGSALIDNQAGGVIAGASGVQDSNNGFGSTNQGYGVRNDGLISGSLGNGIYLG